MRKDGGCPRKQAVEQVLGYLNFSSGTPDPKFLAALSQLWGSPPPTPGQPVWQAVGADLRAELQGLVATSPAFQNATQASALLRLVWDETLPAYLDFHRDLLFHQPADGVFNAFLVGRVCEAVLLQGGGHDAHRIASGAIKHLNDYLGHRPIAVLEGKKVEPYEHERIRPVPLFVRGAGVATGRYQAVVTQALKLLEETDEDILAAAYFEPAVLEELAFDPRAYDFDHPANKRPNYHFGQWDPLRINKQGLYTRFVVQQITLDALMQRLTLDELAPEELLFEAAAVLAGIILMASGISGNGPAAHDSTTTLTTLLPRVAGYRDVFYERLMSRVGPGHRERLRQEAAERRQPFGAARQHLNAQLARYRASQLEHVQLAKIFARIGYPDAATREAATVPTASARLLCRIDCGLASARDALTRRDPSQCAVLLTEVVQTLHRGIACGAIVDPWNVLGFDAQFSLFPAAENSVHDHRIDDLILLLEEIFGIYSRAWSDAASANNEELSHRLAQDFRQLVDWWRQFAAHEVSQVEAIDAHDAYQAAEHVARALNLWHKGGATEGNIGFWAPHAEMFDSAQAYALVIEAMLDQSDDVAAMSLLIRWLSESARIPLEQGESSFHRLTERWLMDLYRKQRAHGETAADTPPEGLSHATWTKIRKFFDFLEANAEGYWPIPQFELHASSGGATEKPDLADPFAEEEDGEDDLFGAAYEDVVYRDSTDDGVDSQIFETGGDVTEDELARESERVLDRLAFHATLARLWKSVGLHRLDASCADAVHQERRAALQRWINKLQQNRVELIGLLDQVRGYSIVISQGDHDSMIEYDRRRLVKETLLDQIITTSVEICEAARMLRGILIAESESPREATEEDEEGLAIAAFAAILRRDHAAASQYTNRWIGVLEDQPLLYVPLAKGGDPRAIVAARVRKSSIQDLLTCLPRLGLYVETHRLIETARDMERNNPVGPGAVTEFDELFRIGYKALVESLVVSARDWKEEEQAALHMPHLHDSPLVVCLEQLTEACLHSWLAHSQTLRLSVLEKVGDKRAWQALVEFIERYGGELFTQRFLNLGNVRAILHQSVDEWLHRIAEGDGELADIRLLQELDHQISRRDAVQHLTLVLEAIIENYGEYRDYNSTTTQSDRGELLHTLLDFLRLRTKYDRVCWNLKPVVLAHEILVRRGCKQAAQLWRRALRERIEGEADKFVERLEKLQKKYAMQMPSVADRIHERFLRPLVIDRVCALIAPAVAEARRDGPRPVFRMLQYETEFLTREPSGVGFDLPPWLAALEDEVQLVTHPAHGLDRDALLEAAIPPQHLSYAEALERLDEWTRPDEQES